MIENLQDEIYRKENKQAKGAKVCANIRWELEGGKCSKTFFKVLERQHLQNETISELYTHDNKTKYFSKYFSKIFFKSAKKIMKHFIARRQPPKLKLLSFLLKLLTEKNIY